MRIVLSILALGAFAAGAASAACTDTLSLVGLRQFDLAFKNVRSDVWDSSAVPVFQLAQAKALKTLPLDKDSLSLVDIPVRFQSNCGTDSIDQVQILVLKDSSYLQRGTRIWKDTAYLRTAAVKVRSYGAASSNGVAYAGLWQIFDDATYTVGQGQSASPALYRVQYNLIAWSKTGTSYFKTFTQVPLPDRASAFDDVKTMIEDDGAAYLAGVGTTFDSVKFAARVFEATYSYDPTPWAMVTGIRARAARAHAFSAYRVSEGYAFVLPRAVSVSVIAPSGAVVRVLPASSAPAWDGRDSHGRRVPRGVYLVRAMGLGVLSIAAP